ncbi:MAG: patatin-like phospholipase family protein [Alphaproteobacteria bacterium]|nr:patatin-like phospholipase family protein [Alphaproteobacteria bacterium]
MPRPSARTAFVFAGGGSLGAIQVGALGEIVRAGERPHFVVGASVGALNACYYAARPDVEGRLFFNLNARVQSKWERDASGQIRNADAHWHSVHTKDGA